MVAYGRNQEKVAVAGIPYDQLPARQPRQLGVPPARPSPVTTSAMTDEELLGAKLLDTHALLWAIIDPEIVAVCRPLGNHRSGGLAAAVRYRSGKWHQVSARNSR